MFFVSETRFRYHGPIHIHWVLNFANSIRDCTPKGSQGLEGGLIPFDTSDIPQDFTGKANRRQFTHTRATFSIHGTATVPKTNGYNATIDYSAKATVKKVVIPDGCVDTHPQHAFVCTN